MKNLYVYMNNELIGGLIKESNGAHIFQYSEEWINNPRSRALSLSLPLQYKKITSDNVINYFDNLLPDLTEVRAKIVTRYQAKSTQAFDLLEKIGRDSVGAVTLLPRKIVQGSLALNYDVLTKDRLEQVLSAYKSNLPLGMLEDEDDFRISIAGAQEKTAQLKLDDQWCIPHGNTPTTHIIKLPIGEIHQPGAVLDMSTSVENEFVCIELARELGFEVPHVEIIQSGEVKALAVERFDRRWSQDKSWIIRLPQEDFCQAVGNPSAIKYESDGGVGIKEIMNLLSGSSHALADRKAFMRFQILQWLIGATDGHSKNFSLFLEKGGSYRLTPFYDIISAYPLVGKKGLNIRKLKLAMGLKASKGKKYHIDKIYTRHFIDTAKMVGFDVKQMQILMDELAVQLPIAIGLLEARLPSLIPSHISESIFELSKLRAKRLITH